MQLEISEAEKDRDAIRDRAHRDRDEAARRMTYDATRGTLPTPRWGIFTGSQVRGWFDLQEQNRRDIFDAPGELREQAQQAAMARNVSFGIAAIGNVAGRAASAAGGLFGAMNQARYGAMEHERMQALIRGNSLEADLAGINAQRQQALDSIRGPSGAFDQMRYSIEKAGVEEHFGDMEELRKKQEKQLDDRIGLGLKSERSLIEARSYRLGPAVEAATSILGRGLDIAMVLEQRGKSRFAVQSLQSTMRLLDLTKEDYFRSFRGQQVDLRTADFSNPTDVFNPQQIVKTIEDFKAEVLRKIESLASD
jgi:hypothetical protein